MQTNHTRRGNTHIYQAGQAVPDNAPVQGPLSFLERGKNYLHCQVEPGLHKQPSGFTLIELLAIQLMA